MCIKLLLSMKRPTFISHVIIMAYNLKPQKFFHLRKWQTNSQPAAPGGRREDRKEGIETSKIFIHIETVIYFPLHVPFHFPDYPLQPTHQMYRNRWPPCRSRTLPRAQPLHKQSLQAMPTLPFGTFLLLQLASSAMTSRRCQSMAEEEVLLLRTRKKNREINFKY